MEVTYELTERDFVEAYSTHRSRTSSGKWTRGIAYLFCAIILAALIFAGIAAHGSFQLQNMVTLVILAAGWFVVLRYLPQFNVRRQFRKQPGAHGPRTVAFDAEGSHWRWDGGSSDVAWKNYIQWIEGDKQILLYGSPACFNMLPKRVFDPGQLAELRELLKQNIQPKK